MSTPPPPSPPNDATPEVEVGAGTREEKEKNIKYLSTSEAYERWAAIYDTDHNPLQALDDLELKTLLPKFLNLVSDTFLTSQPPPPPPPLSTSSSLPTNPTTNNATKIKIIDLGCGTGRNTAKLLSWKPPPRMIEKKGEVEVEIEIVGLDGSEKMLEKARERCADVGGEGGGGGVESTTPYLKQRVRFQQYKIPIPIPIPISSSPSSLPSSSPPSTARAHALISTLLLEHLPLSTFFSLVSTLLLYPTGLLLLTNMHPEMGAISQAGFKDPVTGEKVRAGRSWIHGVGEVVEKAKGWGFEVLGGVREVGMDGLDMGVKGGLGLGPEMEVRMRKWKGTKCWFGIIFRFVGRAGI
ncbi:MAG: hypothetical protein M1834_006829 [Cirrosporium novae-zelandiae]|nr:MAG: hypothetical protein M1834_006829 [Cirrosporium novae-zelandiae]